jgi:protein transport protein SEC61 subunit alpha
MAPMIKYVPLLDGPKAPVSLQNKTIITAATLIVYLASCQIPLLGISRIDGADPLGWVRAILASSRGTLMELGISPIITAGWVMHLAGFFKIMNTANATSRDMAFGEAVGTVTYGYYSHLPTFTQFTIVVQLVFSTIMIMYVDDILSGGYGLGSGTSLFIAVNTA